MTGKSIVMAAMGVAFLGLLFVIYIMFSSSGEARDSQTRTEDLDHVDNSEQIAKMQHQINVLSANVSNLKTDVREVERTAPEIAKESVREAQEAEPPTFEEVREQDIRTLKSYRAIMKNEQRDTRWADKIENAVDDILIEKGIEGTQLVGRECASSICRAEILNDNDEIRDKAISEIAMTYPFSFGGYFSYAEDYSEDDLRTVMYFAREGHQMPKLPGSE